jgi:hypothetical protein
MTRYDVGKWLDEELIMYDVLRLQQEEHHSTLSLSLSFVVDEVIFDCEIWFCLLVNALGFWLSHNRRL